MKQLRERQKLRTVDVASRLGIAESTVRNWEHGRTTPKLRVDQVVELCRLYQCSIEELGSSVKKSLAQEGDRDV